MRYAVCLLLGCGDPESIADSSEDSSANTDSETSDDGTDSAAPGRYATGIHIDRIEANQGVAVALAENGELILPESRPVGLIHGRPTLIRAYWTLDASWTPRDILADLILTAPDGATGTRRCAIVVDGPPDAESIEGAFYWRLHAEDVIPGTRFAIELKETAHSQKGTSKPELGARTPKTGDADMGIGDATMTLDMVLVPLIPPGRDSVPIEAADKTAVETALMELLPVQEISVDWQPAQPQSKFYEHPEEAWRDIHDLRAALGLAPDDYLHVLLDPTTCCNNEAFDFTGLGGNAGATQDDEDSNKRSAMVMIKEDVASAALFIVHELGHNHGLKHAPCGDVDKLDHAYPYPNGLTHTQGYGILSDKLHSGDPTISHPYYDMMTYCWPVWFSDYNFEAMRKRIELVSSW